jgi:hypothetical protein
MTGEDAIAVVQEHLEGLQEDHGPDHPEVIETWTKLAELTGTHGEHRDAAALYQRLGDTLREHVGPFDGRVLDAYEGMARWVGRGS